MKVTICIIVVLIGLVKTEAEVLNDTNLLGSAQGDPSQKNLEPYAETFKKRCPVCDSSVFSYCSDKLFHDSCCCHNPNNPYDTVPYQCHLADCSFLHANTCYEHKLITACCCVS